MKALTEPVWRNAKNAWGGYSNSSVQIFQVEETDVGLIKRHFGGHNHKEVRLTWEHVGEKIAVYRDNTNWTCWVWHTEERAAA